jgi:hypothetical protein
MAKNLSHYSYRSWGRSPVNVIILTVSLIMIGVGTYHQQSFWMLIPLVFAAGVCAYAIILNPVHGLDINEATLAIITPNGRQEFYLSAINRVNIHGWTDSVDVDIYLSDGQKVQLSSLAYSNTTSLQNALEAHAVTVTKE